MTDRQVTTTTPGTSADVRPDATPTATGAGVTALDALLAKGKPPPASVVALIDAHRGDRTAMFQLLQTKLGNAYVQQVTASMNHLRVSVPRREIAAGDPSNPNAGSFLASVANKDATWRTSSGDNTGKIDQSGLNTTEKLDASNDLNGKINAKTKEATIDWDHEAKAEAELFAGKTATGWDAGLRRNDAVGGGTLTTSASYASNKGVGTEQLEEKYVDGSNTVDATEAYANNGTRSVGVTDTDKLDKTATLTGGFHVSDTAAGARTETLNAGYTNTADGVTVNGTLIDNPNGSITGSVTGSDKLDSTTTVNGSVTHTATSTAATIGGEWKSGHDDLSGSVTETYTDPVATKPNQPLTETVVKSHETLDGERVATSGDFEAGYGQRDYAKANGEVDVGVAPNVYAGAFGSVDVEDGKPTTKSAGASITVTPDEKLALTVAGLVNNNGSFETRLQVDEFKTKIANVDVLSSEKKNAIVSLFISYTSKAKPGLLNNELGAPEYSTTDPTGNGGEIMAGVRVKF